MRACKGWTDYILIGYKKFLQRRLKLKNVVAFPKPKINFFWKKNLNFSKHLIFELFLNENILSTSKILIQLILFEKCLQLTEKILQFFSMFNVWFNIFGISYLLPLDCWIEFLSMR